MLYVATETASDTKLSSASSAFIVNKRVIVMGESTEKGGAYTSEQKIMCTI